MLSDDEILALLDDVATNKDHLFDLADQFGRRSGILPFVGAGMSVAFHYPQWEVFLLQAAAEAGTVPQTKILLNTSRYEEAASSILEVLGQRRFQDLMSNNFGDQVIEGKQLAGAVRELTKLPPGPLITTNFDRVLETAFAQAGQPLTPYTCKEADRGPEALQQDKPFLLKLHGDWDRPDARVLTLGEYQAAYGSHDLDTINFALPLPTLLFQLLSTRCCLFVGCSLKQDRTMQILRAITRGNTHLVHYAIVERPADEVEFRSRAAELSAEGIRPIWFPTRAFGCIETLLGWLAAKARQGLTKLVHDFASHANGKDVPNNIAELPNATVGRSIETRQVREMLHVARVVTITGVGGCGKSRLAMEIASQSKAEYEDGIWIIGLADLGREADREGVLAPRVGRTIGAPEQAGRPPHESIAERIGEQRLLLVLDNCEHLINSCRRFLAYLLPACPNLTVLATSRRPLNREVGTGPGLPEERLYPLAPLSKPESEDDSLEVIARNESVMLFVARARERSAGWELTPARAKAVAKLCRALDGIPLAIEVTAARFPVMSVEEMAADCEHLLAAVGSIRASGLQRWKTLTAALRWSYQLLTGRQQRFMRAMSVFNGGWTVQAAEAVYAPSASDREAVMDHLGELLLNSLVMNTDAKGITRFRYLEPIRQMADAQLKPEERAEFKRKHASYFLALAEQAAPELLKAQQSEWLDRLQSDVDNFRAAFRWSVDNVQPEYGLRLFSAIWRFAEIRGQLTEGRSRGNDVLGIPGVESFPALLAKALSGAGMLAYRQADFKEAEAIFDRCLAIETNQGNQAGIANAYNDLGNVYNMQGKFTLAGKSYRESRDIEERLGNARAVAVAKFNMGMVALGMGDYAEAERLMTESRDEFRAGGNDRESAFPLNGLGQVAVATGKLGLAQDYAQASYDLRHKVGDTKGMADTLRTFAWASLEGANYADARGKLSESIRMARGVGDKRGVAEALELYGILYARLERSDRSVEALGAAEQIRHGFNYALPPVRVERRDAALAEGRKRLGELEYERAWKRGSSLTLPDAVDRASRPDTMEAAQ